MLLLVTFLGWLLLLLLLGPLSIDGLANFHRGVLKLLEGLPEPLRIRLVPLHRLIQLINVAPDLVLDCVWDAGSVLLQLLLSVVYHGISFVL